MGRKMPRKLEPGRAAAGPTTEGLGTARNLSMPTKQRRAATDYAHALSIAKRAGLGISGALNGAIVASYLSYAGISWFDAVGTAAALMIFGWTGSFIGVTLASSPAAAQGADPLRSSAHPSEVLSAAGTFVASATAFIAAWLLVSHAPLTILWASTIGFWWLFGVTLQIVAGALARLRAVEPEIG
jgi:hypothetical protein